MVCLFRSPRDLFPAVFDSRIRKTSLLKRLQPLREIRGDHEVRKFEHFLLMQIATYAPDVTNDCRLRHSISKAAHSLAKEKSACCRALATISAMRSISNDDNSTSRQLR